MAEVASIINYLYWGSVIGAALYAFWTVCPSILVLFFADDLKCLDCRSKDPCNCNEYRHELIKDIKRLERQAASILHYYNEAGWPRRFNGGIEQRLGRFLVEVAETVEFLSCEDVPVMSCVENIDTFCAFFNSLESESELQKAARRVKARRDNPPKSWPPEEEVSSWERWE